MYQKILVPLDGSPLSEAVLPHVQALAQSQRTSIVLLRVRDYPTREVPTPQQILSAQRVDADDQAQAAIRDYLERKASTLRASGLAVRTEYRDGPVAEMILDTADALQADLIAMSTHGRSGLTRWLIGSVAEKIVHAAQVPVLLIRPTQPAAAAQAL